MLHKKSEYRLQYNKLDKDLRRQIWQDNISLRKSRLMSNQTTHYWEYQLTSEVCDCDIGEDDDDDEGDEGHLPPHRRRHKHLREQYKQQMEKEQIYPEKKDASTVTANRTDDETDNSLEATNEEVLARNMGSLSLPGVKDRPQTTTPRTAHTRTSRKTLVDGRKTHFVPFGWNERNTDVGHKLTYNVCAPEKEVHDSAILAAQRRKTDINLFLPQKKQVKCQTKPRERAKSSNSNNMWVSEYREQFSARCPRSSRPLSAPPAPRQPVTWRHS